MSHKEARTEFGAWVRERRRAHGLDQAELAEILGLSSGAVSKWEMGSNVPSGDTRKKLHDLFGPGPLAQHMPATALGKEPVKQPAPQQVTLTIPPQLAMPAKPVMNPQSGLPADVQAAIDTILRLPWQAQETIVAILRLALERREYEGRLLAQMGAGDDK